MLHEKGRHSDSRVTVSALSPAGLDGDLRDSCNLALMLLLPSTTSCCWFVSCSEGSRGCQICKTKQLFLQQCNTRPVLSRDTLNCLELGMHQLCSLNTYLWSHDKLPKLASLNESRLLDRYWKCNIKMKTVLSVQTLHLLPVLWNCLSICHIWFVCNSVCWQCFLSGLSHMTDFLL